MPVYIILQLIFFATEVSLLLFKRSKTTVKNSRDKRSLLILWVVIVTGSTLGPDISAHGLWSMTGINVTYAGIAVFAIGFIIRWSAVIQLGKMFTVDVAIVDKHSLKTSGLYKIVRHPSYLGLILIIIAAINYRISVEEKALTEQFGEQYTTYKTRVKKLVPYIY
jgi:protein-S-isoprenylcysteine O-methyltransferase Ste14